MRDAELIKVFNRRALLVAGGELFLFSILAGRLYQLQILDSDKYKKLSERNSVRIKLLPPPRGIIADRFGVELAINVNSYGIQMIPEEVTAQGLTVEEILNRISELIPLTEKEKEKVLNNVKKKRAFFPVFVKNNLGWDEMAKIQVNNLDFTGVYVEEGKRRYYPFDEIAAHVIGYVSDVTEQELKKDPSPILQLPDFKTGKAGIEKLMDRELRGEVGETIQIVNAVGRVIETLDDKKKKAIPGQRINLTIDKRLQEYAYKRINEESASVVVMDIYNGDVLMMISVPSYNPNIFLDEDMSAKEFEKLFSNPRHPFINKAIEGLYAPGSTFKMMTALAALSDGKINANTKINCTGHMDYGDGRYHCWNTGGHGLLNLEQSLLHSCDIFYYALATKVSMDVIQEMAYRFGLGDYTGIELANEKKGQVPSREWKRNYKSEAWYTGDTITASIGQGYTLVTPIQLAVMTARIANGGFAVKPRIIKNENEGNIFFPSLNINPQHLNMIKRGMFAVVNRPNGTGRNAYLNYNGSYMAGKTGTTQVKRITREERARGVTKQEDLPWKYRNHALFVGYAPYKNPRYAISVVVEHGMSGSGSAAPIARDIMMKTLELYL